MIYLKKYNDLFENAGVNKNYKPEKLPHCSEMQSRGYRTATIDNDWYAFQKDFDIDDDIYWLGEDTIDYQYGQKYIATQDIVNDKELPFYSIYCKCDPNLTDEERKRIIDRDKEIEKRRERLKKEKEKLLKEKTKKKK